MPLKLLLVVHVVGGGVVSEEPLLLLLPAGLVLAAVVPVLDRIVAAVVEVAGYVGPLGALERDQPEDEVALLRCYGVVAQRRFEVLVIPLAALLGGPGADLLRNLDPVLDLVHAGDQLHEQRVLGLGPRTAPLVLTGLRRLEGDLGCWGGGGGGGGRGLGHWGRFSVVFSGRGLLVGRDPDREAGSGRELACLVHCGRFRDGHRVRVLFSCSCLRCRPGDPRESRRALSAGMLIGVKNARRC